MLERLLLRRERISKDKRDSKLTKLRLEHNLTGNLSNKEQELRDLKIKSLLPEEKLSNKLPRLLKLQELSSKDREKQQRRELEQLRSREFKEQSKRRSLSLLKSSKISKTRRSKN